MKRPQQRREALSSRPNSRAGSGSPALAASTATRAAKSPRRVATMLAATPLPEPTSGWPQSQRSPSMRLPRVDRTPTPVRQCRHQAFISPSLPCRLQPAGDLLPQPRGHRPSAWSNAARNVAVFGSGWLLTLAPVDVPRVAGRLVAADALRIPADRDRVRTARYWDVTLLFPCAAAVLAPVHESAPLLLGAVVGVGQSP